MKKDYIKPAVVCCNFAIKTFIATSIVITDEDADPKYEGGGDAKGSMWDFMNEEEE